MTDLEKLNRIRRNWDYITELQRAGKIPVAEAQAKLANLQRQRRQLAAKSNKQSQLSLIDEDNGAAQSALV